MNDEPALVIRELRSQGKVVESITRQALLCSPGLTNINSSLPYRRL